MRRGVNICLLKEGELSAVVGGNFLSVPHKQLQWDWIIPPLNTIKHHILFSCLHLLASFIFYVMKENVI